MCTHTIDMHELKGAVRWVLTSETTFKLHTVNYRYPYMYSIHSYVAGYEKTGHVQENFRQNC